MSAIWMQCLLGLWKLSIKEQFVDEANLLENTTKCNCCKALLVLTIVLLNLLNAIFPTSEFSSSIFFQAGMSQ